MDRRIKTAWIVLILLGLLWAPAYADTTQDILHLYGIEHKVDVSALEEEISVLKDGLYAAAEKDLYNSAMSNLNTNDLDEEIASCVIRMEEIIELTDAGIDCSVEELLSLESEYRLLEEKANTLLSYRDSYVATEVSSESAYAAAQEAVQLLTEELARVGNYVNIGSLKDFRGPLDSWHITSPFGNRIDPVTGKGIQFHKGVDLRAAIGSSVYTPFHGIVKSTGYSTAGGYYVRVDHGNSLESVFYHLSKIVVSEGDVVVQYQKVAESGNTGKRTTGPHLHWGFFVNGTAVDPAILIQQKE